MMSFKASAGNARTIEAIMNLPKNFQNGVRKGLQTSGVQIAGLAGRANDGLIKKEMNQPKSGRIYLVGVGRGGKRLKKIRLHQASRAGESPAVISGALRKSVYFRVEGSNQLRIGADTSYARILEEGGTTGRNHATKIARRNYLKRPILQSRKDVIQNIENAIKNNVGK